MLRLPGKLAARSRTAEIMDRPDLEPDLHRRTLGGLATLNFLSRSVGILWPRIYRLAQRLRRPVRVLDLGPGDGRRRCSPESLETCPKGGRAGRYPGNRYQSLALEVAQARAEKARSALRFAQADVLSEDLPGDYDIITCSLFLHHLDDQDAIPLLAAERASTLLVDKSAFPREKVCGSCLNGAALAALGVAGLADLPGRLGASALRKMRLRRGVRGQLGAAGRCVALAPCVGRGPSAESDRKRSCFLALYRRDP